MNLEQEPFEPNEAYISDFATKDIKNMSDRHVGSVIIADTSGSMQSDNAIDAVNTGLKVFKENTIANGEFLADCIDAALIKCGPTVDVLQNFMPVSEMSIPTLTADGVTPIGQALNKALDMVLVQTSKYRELGTPYYRPWIFLFTDGEPTDSYMQAAMRLKEMEKEKHVIGYCVGVRNFNRAKMEEIFDRKRIFVMEDLDFSKVFEFLSNSLIAVQNSVDGTANVELPNNVVPMGNLD